VENYMEETSLQIYIVANGQNANEGNG